jgi:hypothetical protein
MEGERELPFQGRSPSRAYCAARPRDRKLGPENGRWSRDWQRIPRCISSSVQRHSRRSRVCSRKEASKRDGGEGLLRKGADALRKSLPSISDHHHLAAVRRAGAVPTTHIVEIQAATLALALNEAMAAEGLLLEHRRFRTRLRLRSFQLVGCSLECCPADEAGEGEISRLRRPRDPLPLGVREPHRNDASRRFARITTSLTISAEGLSFRLTMRLCEFSSRKTSAGSPPCCLKKTGSRSFL